MSLFLTEMVMCGQGEDEHKIYLKRDSFIMNGSCQNGVSFNADSQVFGYKVVQYISLRAEREKVSSFSVFVRYSVFLSDHLQRR